MRRHTVLRRKLTNLAQSILLLAGMAALLGALGWVLGGSVGMIWTLVLAVGLLSFSPRLSPRLLVRLYGAWEISPRQAPALFEVMEALAARAGLSNVPRLYYLPSPVLNAFAAGGSGDAVIVLSDGLLRSLTQRELAGVLAHELSHVRNRDVWVMSLADLVSRLTGMLSLVGQLALVISLPFYLLGRAPVPWPAIALLIGAPLLSVTLQLALSRAREYDADLEAAALTGDPGGLGGALEKLERRQGSWLERLLTPGRRESEPSLLRTHPPNEERIRRLLALEQAVPADAPSVQASGPRQHVPVGRPPLQRRPRWHIGGWWY